MSIAFEPLNTSHINALLRFETDNRDYFECLIAPRPNHFYSEAGVCAHVAELSTMRARGLAFPVVLMNHGHILGRVNLKDISVANGHAELGYRIAKDAVGKGMATHAVAWMCEYAKHALGLSTINAMVLSNNPASRHVLSKNNFVHCNVLPHFAEHKGSWLDCDIFRKDLKRKES